MGISTIKILLTLVLVLNFNGGRMNNLPFINLYHSFSQQDHGIIALPFGLGKEVVGV